MSIYNFVLSFLDDNWSIGESLCITDIFQIFFCSVFICIFWSSSILRKKSRSFINDNLRCLTWLNSERLIESVFVCRTWLLWIVWWIIIDSLIQLNSLWLLWKLKFSWLFGSICHSCHSFPINFIFCLLLYFSIDDIIFWVEKD